MKVREPIKFFCGLFRLFSKSKRPDRDSTLRPDGTAQTCPIDPLTDATHAIPLANYLSCMSPNPFVCLPHTQPHHSPRVMRC